MLILTPLLTWVTLRSQAIIAVTACDQTTINAWPYEQSLFALREHFQQRRLLHDARKESYARGTNKTQPKLRMQ